VNRFLSATTLLIATCLSVPCFSQTQAAIWPTRPIRMVIGYPPGGSTDVAGRLLAEALGRRLGQQVIVDNRPGAGGTLAAASVVRAEPDGYTLLLAASPEVSIAPITMRALPYDPVRDLAAISMVGQVPFLLVVNAQLPIASVRELVAYDKAHPKALNYSSFGNNTSNNLAGELFKSVTGTSAVHVPYKGSGPSIIDLIGGQVQYTFDTPPAVMANVKAGKLRALAVATDERLASAPSIPTMAEAGVPDFIAGTWFGLLAPSKTPKAVIERINKETVAALTSQELSKAFLDQGIVPKPDTPIAFQTFISSEVAKWKTLADKIGIVAE
jgi:tripartite-type tricarboxylate transporter receptor subunit TctC